MFVFDAIAALPVWAIYSLAAWAAGAWLLRHLAPAYLEGQAANPGLALALGLGSFGVLWSLLALVPDGMQPLSVWAVLIVSLLLGANPVYTYLKTFSFRSLLPQQKAVRWLALPLAALLLIAPLLTWYPLGTDANSFYFAQAKLVAYTREFVPLPGYEGFAQIPLPAEFTYTALMLIGNDFAARLINATELWACVLLIAAIAQACRLSNTGIWLSVLILLGSTSVTLLVTDGKTDLYGGMLGLAAVYAFVYAPSLAGRQVALMGILSGFAVLAKLSFLPVLVPMLATLLAWKAIAGSTLKAALPVVFRAGSAIAVLVILCCIPLILKNWLAYGEPFAPFLFLSAAHDDGLLGQDWFSADATRWILLTYPLVWLFGQYPMQHGVISPLLLAGLPALLMVRWKQLDWRNDAALVLALAGLLGLLVWALLYPSVIAPRYIFPALLAFVPLAARGIEMTWQSLEGSRIAYSSYAALLLAFAILPLTYHKTEAKYALRWIERGPFRSYVDYIWQGLQVAEGVMPQGSRMLLVGWERSPLRPATLNCLITEKEIGGAAILSEHKKPEDVWRDIYLAGGRVMLVNVVGRKDFADKIDVNRKPDWLDVGAGRINEFYTFYTLTPKKGAPDPVWKCAPSKRDVWEPTLNEITKNG